MKNKMAELILDIVKNVSIYRMRVDGIDVFSVFDFINYVCNYRYTLKKVCYYLKNEIDAELKTTIYHIRSNGKWQRSKPFMTIVGLSKLLLILGSKATVEFGNHALECFNRVLAGDHTLINEITTAPAPESAPAPECIITGITNINPRESRVVKGFEKMTEGLFERLKKRRFKKARAEYKKLVYDRNFQRNRYHEHKNDPIKIEKWRANSRKYYAVNREKMNAYKRALRLRNPEKFKATSRKYYTDNREKMKGYYRARRLRNPEKFKANLRKYYAVNSEKFKAYMRKYYAVNREKMKTYHRAWKLRNPEKCKAISRKHIRKRYAANPEKWKTYSKAWILRKHGCIECKEWPDGQRGYSHYDGMCWRCFSEKFPDDERVKSRGRVELRVRSYLDSHFPDFVHDQPIHTAHCVCSHRRRVDHRRLIGNTLLCVETDENFHRYYNEDDEEARYHDVIMAWGGKLCFVRFNPHQFNLDDRCDQGPPLAERLERLRAEVTRHIGRLERGENTAYLEVHHLYYPKGTPDLYEEQSKPEWLGGTQSSEQALSRL